MIQFHFLLIFACLSNSQFAGDLRLVDSISKNAQGAGRLEIFLQGQWGTVCDDFINLTEADVACRQLGYPSARGVGDVQTLHFPVADSSTRIWLDNVRCSSTDKLLLACSHDGLGNHNCVHSEDVAIVCAAGARTRMGRSSHMNGTHTTLVNRTRSTLTTTTATATTNAELTTVVVNIGDEEDEGNLRLVGGDSESEGRLEIFLRGEWGTVCDDGFSVTNAYIACRQLGYDSASQVGSVDQLGYPQASPETEVWLDDVDCSIFDTSLLSCSHRGIGVRDCTHSEDVALVCSTSAFEGPSGIFTGAVTAFLVAVLFIFFVGIPALAYCVHAISRLRTSSIRTQHRPASAASLTFSAYFRRLGQPISEYILEEAPPPYSEINAYPSALPPNSTSPTYSEANPSVLPPNFTSPPYSEANAHPSALPPNSTSPTYSEANAHPSALPPNSTSPPYSEAIAHPSTLPQNSSFISTEPIQSDVQQPQLHATESQASVLNPGDQPASNSQSSTKKHHQQTSTPTESQASVLNLAEQSAKDPQSSLKKPQQGTSSTTEHPTRTNWPAKDPQKPQRHASSLSESQPSVLINPADQPAKDPQSCLKKPEKRTSSLSESQPSVFINPADQPAAEPQSSFKKRASTPPEYQTPAICPAEDSQPSFMKPHRVSDTAHFSADSQSLASSSAEPDISPNQ